MKVDVIVSDWAKEYNIMRNVYFPYAPVIDLVTLREPWVLLST